MAATETYPSLMDDVEFLAELEKFDPQASASECTPSARGVRSIDTLAWADRPMFDDSPDPPPPSDLSPRGRIALAVVAVLLMMSVGGAAATVVLHDRVTQILAQWHDTRASR